MRKLLTGTLMAGVLVALPLAAGAQQLFDFTGQSLISNYVGGSAGMFGEVFDPAPATTPIPLDFAHNQYTVVVLATIAGISPFSRSFSGGTITIYEDAGTAADYTNPATFSDGTAILLGNLKNFSQFLPPAGPGSVSGLVDWTGGSRLDDIAPGDQSDWAFLSGSSPDSGLLEPGYDEVWDGKVEPQEPIVADEASAFGSVKALFRN